MHPAQPPSGAAPSPEQRGVQRPPWPCPPALRQWVCRCCWCCAWPACLACWQRPGPVCGGGMAPCDGLSFHCQFIEGFGMWLVTVDALMLLLRSAPPCPPAPQQCKALNLLRSVHGRHAYHGVHAGQRAWCRWQAK